MKEMIASDGNWLTQVNAEHEHRIFVSKVEGVHATFHYWREVTNEWKEQWEAEHPQPEEPAEVVE